MFANMLGGLVDKEQMTIDTIEACLERLSKELNCEYSQLFVMIKPTNDEFEFKCWVYKSESSSPPKMVREITIKEILGKD
jgi:hypothetical protein